LGLIFAFRQGSSDERGVTFGAQGPRFEPHTGTQVLTQKTMDI